MDHILAGIETCWGYCWAQFFLGFLKALLKTLSFSIKTLCEIFHKIRNNTVLSCVDDQWMDFTQPCDHLSWWKLFFFLDPSGNDAIWWTDLSGLKPLARGETTSHGSKQTKDLIQKSPEKIHLENSSGSENPRIPTPAKWPNISCHV